MTRIRLAAAVTVFVAAGLGTASAQAFFHLWRFTEFFSNADGSVQFIEMRTTSNNEHFAAGSQVRSQSTGNVFTFPNNLSTSLTANRHLLLATAGFDSLPGGVMPDFILPSQFFNPNGDTISLIAGGPVDSKTFASLSTDGINSLNYNPPSATATTAVNSPTNFAGASGSVDLSAPPGLSGDFNEDGTVDAADYTVWRDGLGSEFEPAHYDEWKENFGAVQPAAAVAVSAAVPEPGTILVAALAMLLTGLYQRPLRKVRLAA